MPEVSFFKTLREMAQSGAEFIIVGSVSAVLNGAPVSTFDFEVVYKRSTENIRRLPAYGAFDLLATIGKGLTYEDLLAHTDEVDIEEGVRVRVLNLQTLIRLKEQSNGDKDRAVLPILRRTLEESLNSSS